MKYLIVKASTVNQYPNNEKCLNYKIEDPPCSEAEPIECFDENGISQK